MNPGLLFNHVQWCARDLDVDDDRLRGLEQWLSADERERAARFRFPVHQKRFIAARGFLRELLGHYTGNNPASLIFTYGTHGKPFLTDSAISFNLAHSGSRAVYAVSGGCAVGIDVEEVRPSIDLDGIARRFFAPAEIEQLSQLSPDTRTEGFFRCWTRKEAFLKGLGEGLHFPLNRFVVSVGEQAELRWAETSDWSLHHLESGAGFVGALAVQNARPRVEHVP